MSEVGQPVTIYAPPARAEAKALPPRIHIVFALVTPTEHIIHVPPPESAPHPDHGGQIGFAGTEIVVVAVVVLVTGTVRTFVGRLP